MATLTPAELGIGWLFGAMTDAVVIADLDSEQVVLLNAAAGRIFGLDPADAEGLPLETLIPPPHRARHQAGMATYRRTGRGTFIDTTELVAVPALTSDGRTLDVELRLSPLPSVGGRRFVLALIRDVTERNALAAALAESRQALERALAAEQATTARLRHLVSLRDDLMNVLAHELRTPMAVIMGFAGLLGEQGRLDPEQRKEALGRIVSGATQLDRLVSDLLDVVRLDSGTLTLERAPFDLAAVLASAAATLDESHGRPRVALRVPEPLPLALGDEARQRQVAMTLLGSAALWSPPDRPVEVVATRLASAIQVSIRDHGPGLADDERAVLFQRFARREPAGAGLEHGTGLGLTIAHGLVLAQGGEIEVGPARGAGTTIVYTVPLSPDGAAGPRATVEAPPPAS